jgi:4-hydroxysphinganine ceramide fatty acyl 2-hydroxylase
VALHLKEFLTDQFEYIIHRFILHVYFAKWMKKFHLLHHFKSSNHYFGVTNPSIDIIAGTYPPPMKPTKHNEDI